MPAKPQNPDTIPIVELQKRKEKALELIKQIKDLFPDLVVLTEEDRKYSQGRLRNGEADVLRTVLQGIDEHPEYFKSLADEDEGHDPTTLETDLLRDRLARRDAYQKVAEALEPLSTGLSDTTLYFGGLVRPVTLAAYRIAKTIAQTDKKLRTLIAPAIDFYRGPAKARANKKPT